MAVFRKYTGTLRVLSVNPGSVLWILLTTAKFFSSVVVVVVVVVRLFGYIPLQALLFDIEHSIL